MPRVFISHATADRDFIEREIIPLLQRNGVETWYARDDIAAADEWERTILQGLRSCDYFLVVMSPHSARSRWVKREVDWAFHKGEKPVVPVLLADCDSDDFHIGLAGIQHVDYRHDLETARSRLLAFFSPQGPPKAALPFGKRLPAMPAELTNAVGMKLVLVPPGTFWMGSPQMEAERQDDEGPRHQVTITRPFYLGVNPVTQREFQTVMGYNPAHFTEDKDGGPHHPVEQVSWEEAVEFCRRLSALPDGASGRRVYRLPTEAEWEYACRAGTKTRFYWGHVISTANANFDAKRSRDPQAYVPFHWGQTAGVGGYLPNEFGLYGMHGNVWEWCGDWYGEDYYQHSPERDPQGPDGGTLRVLRGGSWFAGGAGCRSAVRHAMPPGEREDDCGFRVALSVS
jgi:formylglycine-generating enzyme required for sulfatase activity